MKRYGKLTLFCSAALLLTASPMTESTSAEWPTFRGNVSRTGQSASAAPRTPTLLWSVRIPEAGDIWSSASVAGGRLFIGGISGELYCLDAETGGMKWEFQTLYEQPVFSSPTVSGGIVFFAAYRAVYALPCEDPDGDGVISSDEIAWKRPLGPSTGGVNDVNPASPAVIDGKLFVGSVDSYFYCFDAAAGGPPIWRTLTPYVGQHAFSSSPAILEDRAFAATGNQSGEGRLYGFGLKNGRIEWEFDNDDITFSTPAAADGRVFIANSGDWIGGNQVHRIFCLDADGMADGIDDGVSDGHAGGSDLVWSTDMGSYAYSSPAVSGGRVYIGCSNGNLLCLDAASGKRIWKYTTDPMNEDPPAGIMGSPVVAGGAVIAGTADGRLIAVPVEDPNADGVISDSELIWSYPVGGLVVSSPAIAYGRVYIAADRGRVLCLAE
jgi:outer membrane protein assembly factor BamB